MPPLALALIDAVFQLALHHDRRARQGAVLLPDHEAASVRAELRGPLAEPSPGAISVEIIVTMSPRSVEAEVAEDRLGFHIDLDEERLLAAAVSLAELPLDRGGVARLIGELESWCYEKLPIDRVAEDDEDGDEDELETELDA